MCVISDNIKFCTCVDAHTTIEALNHYWVLNRFNKRKNLNFIGEVILPYHDIATNHMENQLAISSILEKNDAFDKPISFKDKDRLQIVLNNNSKNRDEHMTFEFEFKSGNWLFIENEDPFHLLNNFDEVQSGEIKEMD